MPEVPIEFRDTVVFLAYRDGAQRVAGTAFLVSSPVDGWDWSADPPTPIPSGDKYRESERRFCLVTAKHVIEGIERKAADSSVLIWVNGTDGRRHQIESELSAWRLAADEATVRPERRPGEGQLVTIAE